MKRKRLTSDEIKKIELEILMEFSSFCERNNLKYYLAYGTLLGAIRHRGFIPWDDDIDIVMPREDYEFFISNFKSDKKCLELRSNRLGNLNAPFTKLVNTDTIVESQFTIDDIDDNLWIDIFPVDGQPEDNFTFDINFRKIKIYRAILVSTTTKLGSGTTFFRKFVKVMLRPLGFIFKKSYLVRKIDLLSQKFHYRECNRVAVVAWSFVGRREIMLKTDFEQSTEVEFEGHKFPAVACWDRYLTNIYGDYMQLPPVEQRKSHNMIAYKIE